MNNKERKIKRSLVKSMKSVRRKFRALRTKRSGLDLKNIETFKPITGKLDKLIDAQRENKIEPKKKTVDDDN